MGYISKPGTGSDTIAPARTHDVKLLEELSALGEQLVGPLPREEVRDNQVPVRFELRGRSRSKSAFR